ncbi:hypothetical protein GCM10011324_43760 [Allosediminivita pacifica]|nr:hypothetical protein GCM10011324_43760 [Allosediminivita pacifica]
MQVLETLRDACDLIAEEVNKKIKSINTQTPDALLNPKINANTVGGKFINGLSEKSDIAKLEALINLTPDDEAEMKSLAADLEGDSAKAIAKLSAVKVAFGQEAKKLKELVEVTSEEKVQELASAREDHTKKVEIAKTASDRLFSAAPLPNIGSELWRELWEAARRYSDHAAYPDKTFPEATADHDLCVLCQQPLSEEAVERRNTFEQFVKGETKAAEAKAKRRAEDALRSIESKQQNHDFVRELTRIIGLELDDPELSMSMRRAAVVARWRLRAIRRGHVPRLPSVPFPAENAKVTWEKLTRRIEQLKGDEASPQRKEMRARLEDLRSRKYLKNFESDIRLEIERRRRIAALKESGKTAAKRAVTELNKSLSDKLVTDALRGRFAREVQKLDIGCMPLELQKSDRNAVSLFRVCFVERPKEPVGDVLSEGEHRCVALAAFLAELVTSREYSGIVFDDPMSSLDHLHRRSVARRLVEEAEHRQVVVFTHDLAFMFELKREAEAQGQSVHYQHVHRRQKQPGHVKGDLPLKAKPGLELANAIRGELKAVKSEFDSFPEARRSIMAKGFIEQIREGWDQGVADFIMPVLGRFDNRIATGSIFKLAVLNDVDVSTVIAARKRLSEELHLYSEALNPSDVSHAGLVAEVAALEDWLRDMKERQGKASLPARSSA